MPDNIHSQDDKEDFDLPVRPLSADRQGFFLPPEESDDESELLVSSRIWN